MIETLFNTFVVIIVFELLNVNMTIKILFII